MDGRRAHRRPSGRRQVVPERPGVHGRLAMQGDEHLAHRETVTGIVSDGFDMAFIARVSLGKHWRKISVLSDKPTSASSANLSSNPTRLRRLTANFHVNDAIESGKRDILVQTNIVQPSGSPISAGWRIRNVEGKLQIIDIIIEGVSMALNQRREFQGVVAKSGMSGLMEMLRARTERLSVEPPA